jgi:TetR/AcrR family transcriptional regulator
VKRVAGATREAILAAAATEFAAHGFAGASVDSIAAGSGFNKAMIYYHFKNKQGLYVEILRDVFRFMGARTAAIAASDRPSRAKIEAFIDALNDMASSRPYMPPIMMREMAEGAIRLDHDTLRLMAAIFNNLRLILEEGVRAGAFRPANPILTYFTLISPVIFFRATAPIRAALQKSHIIDVRLIDADAFVANLKSTALAVLSAGAAPAPAPTRTPRRRSRSTRSGDHA